MGNDSPDSEDVSAEQTRHNCPECGFITQLENESKGWGCQKCRSQHFFVHCPGCGDAQQTHHRKSRCPWCAKEYWTNRAASSTAKDVALALAKRGLTPGPIHPDCRVLAGCTVIGGYGHEMPAGARVTLAFLLDAIRFTVEPGESSRIAYGEVTGLEIGGQGAISSGGGYIGGGFGVGGAVTGILAASVMNAATTSTEIETTITLTTSRWQVIHLYDQVTPDALRVALAPAFGCIDRAGRSAVSAPEGERSLADEIDHLHRLLGNGALTQEEFDTAKRTLLGS